MEVISSDRNSAPEADCPLALKIPGLKSQCSSGMSYALNFGSHKAMTIAWIPDEKKCNQLTNCSPYMLVVQILCRLAKVVSHRGERLVKR